MLKDERANVFDNTIYGMDYDYIIHQYNYLKKGLLDYLGVAYSGRLMYSPRPLSSVIGKFFKTTKYIHFIVFDKPIIKLF